MRDGRRKNVPCLAMFQFYNATMGSKVFYKLLMATVANNHVLCIDSHRTKTPEEQVSLGRSKAAVRRRSAASLGRPPKVRKQRTMFNVGVICPSKEKQAEDVSYVLFSLEKKHEHIRCARNVPS
ncbi:hypothetical protein ILUMI_03092, partial [Ignelater luminosus]